MICRDCDAALPPRPKGKNGPDRQRCDACQAQARRVHQARYYRRHRDEVLRRDRAWRDANPERANEARRRYAQSHTPRSRNRKAMTLYLAAWREAKRLGVDSRLHWFRWISGTLRA